MAIIFSTDFEKGIPSFVNKISQAKFYYDLGVKGDDLPLGVWSIEQAQLYELDIRNNYPGLFEEFERKNLAYYKRRQRLKKHIDFMFKQKYVYFITLTFDNLKLGIKKDSRRQLVRRYLKQFSEYYCANIDYGSINEREHYHALISSPKPLSLKEYKSKDKNGKWQTRFTCKDYFWSNGILDIEEVSTDRKSVVLAKYINKFQNHALKETTNREEERMIYSRGFPKHLDWYDREIISSIDDETGEIFTKSKGNLNLSSWIYNS